MPDNFYVLIKHDTGNTGAGDVIACGFGVDFTQDPDYDPATCSIRTDAPYPCEVLGGEDQDVQYCRFNGTGYESADKPEPPENPPK